MDAIPNSNPARTLVLGEDGFGYLGDSKGGFASFSLAWDSDGGTLRLLQTDEDSPAQEVYSGSVTWRAKGAIALSPPWLVPRSQDPVQHLRLLKRRPTLGGASHPSSGPKGQRN